MGHGEGRLQLDRPARGGDGGIGVAGGDVKSGKIGVGLGQAGVERELNYYTFNNSTSRFLSLFDIKYRHDSQ